MQNKYFKYFLVIGVLAVWSIIIFRVVSGFSQQEKTKPIHLVSPKKVNPVLVDTFSLALNYPDPFLAEIDSVIVDSLSRKVLQASQNNNGPQQQITKETVASIIQYTGIINNPQKNHM